MSSSPQVAPVVGPAVTVALTRLKLLVVVVVEPAVAGIVVAVEPAVDGIVVAFCLMWPTDLLVAQVALAQ